MVMIEKKPDDTQNNITPFYPPEDSFIRWDGLDDAIMGYIDDRWGTGESRLMYSIDKMMQIFMDRDGMSAEDAREYIDFNIIGAYVGKSTPVYFERLDPEVISVFYG